jgi:ATPase family AAA domain-containing protein 3A/B
MIFDNTSNIIWKKITRSCAIGIMALGLTQSFPDQIFAMQHGGVPDALKDFTREAARVAADIAREQARQAEERQHREANLARQISELKESGVADTDPRILEAQRELGRMDREADIGAKAAGVGLGLFEGLGNAVIGDYTADRDLKKAQAQALAKGFMDARGAKERLQMILDQMKDPKQLAKIAAFAAGATLGIVGVYYTVKLIYQYVEASIGKPSLIRESSIDGLNQKLRKFAMSLFKNDEEVEDILGDIILAPDIQEKVYLLADDTRQTKEFALPYQNVLFYGPPGTGKTEFARILSRYSGMDYAILSGADFSQFKDGEGITELHKLFDWANNSKKGLIIFIDEADACFRDRATLDKDGVNLVNAFLSHTGCSSDKFMIILATNYEDELDAAVRSRIHKKIPFMLPALEERFKIIKLKLKKYVLDDVRAYKKDSILVEEKLTIDAELTDAFWTEIAKKIDGFSGRDIDQAVSEMRMRAYRSGKNVLTVDIVESVITDKIVQIKKDKEATEYQRQKFEKMFKGPKNPVII